MSKSLEKIEAERLEAERREAERHRTLMALINQAPVRGPESWPGGFWAKSGPGSYDRGGTWNN